MVDNLVFIEYKDEIDIYEKLFGKDTIVVSLNPAVGVELKQRGISFINSLDLFGVDGHRNTIIISSKITDQLIPLFDKLILVNNKKTIEVNWLFYLRVFLKYWISMLHVVHVAISKYNPKRLVTIKFNNNSKIGIRITEKNKIIGEIITLYAESHEIKIHYEKLLDEDNNKLELLKTLFINWTSVQIFEILLFIYPLVNKNKTSILSPDKSYNMHKFLHEISGQIERSFVVYMEGGYRSIMIDIKNIILGKAFNFLSLPVYSQNNLKFVDRLKEFSNYINMWLKKNKSLTIIYDVNIEKPLSNFISDGLFKGMVELHGKIASMHRLLDVVQPQYVFSQHSLGVNYALGEFCAENIIPSLLIPHGSYVPHSDSIADLEWSGHAQTMINSKFPFVALQTPWASKFLKDQRSVLAQGVITGPLVFGKKYNDINVDDGVKHRLYKGHKNKRIILHASSPRSWKSIRTWIYETTDEYIKNINQVISAIDGIPNLYLAIRFRPKAALSLIDFKASLPPSNCYGIYAEGSFIDYLTNSDLLISYSSTTIEEALQNHIPVLQYDPDGKYEHIPGLQLTNRDDKNIVSSVYTVSSQKDLSPALIWWNRHHGPDENKKIDWSRHVYNTDDEMSWLKLIS